MEFPEEGIRIRHGSCRPLGPRADEPGLIASVAFPVPLRRLFSYRVPEEWRGRLRAGSRVKAPFSGRILIGVVVETGVAPPETARLKEIAEVLDEDPIIDPELFGVIRSVAARFFAPEGEMLRLALPARVPARRRKRAPAQPSSEAPAASVAPAVFSLSGAQERAYAAISGALEARNFYPALLRGVTGSGKTEVYLRSIARTLELGRGALWLVPEIALTPVFARSLTERFGDRAAVIHSGLTDRERGTAWQRIRQGEAPVVIGPRSALFSPVGSLGLIVIDEEQDASYKQEESPRYDARDAAAIRAQATGAVLILGSATPSMETFHAAEAGKIHLLELPERIEGRPLPDVSIVDLKREPALPEEKGIPLFSAPLLARLAEVFSRGEQAILLAPRRGYAPMLLCRACGEDFRCDSCSVARVVHRKDAVLSCHYCGARRPVPTRCPRCGGQVLEAIGAGTERAAERFEALFPRVRFARLDSDTSRRRGTVAEVIGAMESRSIQALIGTQMVAKGHHFPGVTAIGVLSADTILNFPDFRAGEKTFQLISQVAGRAGRGEQPGTVHVQTFHPENPAIRAAVSQDTAGFARQELEFRKTFFYPPFCELASIVVSGADREKASALAHQINDAAAASKELRVSGVAPAAIERIKGRWRFQVLLRSRSRRSILAALEGSVPESAPSGLRVAVDVDPRNLM